MANLGYQNSETPKPSVCHKIWRGRYHPHMPKFKAIAPMGVSQQIGKILISCDFLVTRDFSRVPKLNHGSVLTLFDSIKRRSQVIALPMV